MRDAFCLNWKKGVKDSRISELGEVCNIVNVNGYESS